MKRPTQVEPARTNQGTVLAGDSVGCSTQASTAFVFSSFRLLLSPRATATASDKLECCFACGVAPHAHLEMPMELRNRRLPDPTASGTPETRSRRTRSSSSASVETEPSGREPESETELLLDREREREMPPSSSPTTPSLSSGVEVEPPLKPMGSAVRRVFNRARAWSVHLFTGLGLLVSACSLHLAIYSTTPSFVLFARLNWLAIFIDAVDGTLARRFDVKTWASGLDGALLDNIIDFQTFALLPALALIVFETWIPLFIRYAMAGAVLISAGYAFCQTSAKTDTAFVGFPSYWNVVLFYVHELRPSLGVCIALYAVCAIVSFIPIHFIYPTKTPQFFWITMFGAYVWGSLMAVPVVFPDWEHKKLCIQVSLFYVVYYTAASLLLDSHRRNALQAANANGPAQQ